MPCSEATATAMLNPLTTQQPHQAALGDRTRGELQCSGPEPCHGGLVMDMLWHRQGNQYVAVEQHGHSSSSSWRTSLLVIVLPIWTSGMPWRNSSWTASGCPARATRRRFATVSPSVSDLSRADPPKVDGGAHTGMLLHRCIKMR